MGRRDFEALLKDKLAYNLKSCHVNFMEFYDYE